MLTLGRGAVVALPKVERPPVVREQADLPSADEFEVEGIVEVQYLIKWKGYSAAENTWEPPGHLTHCARLLRRFHRQQLQKLEPPARGRQQPAHP
jgi:Chromo (CHRromatin Organisation MOdifier) domain